MENYAYVYNGPTPWNRRELLIANKDVTLPTENMPVGSIAYTADMSYIAQFDGTNWVEIGGENA